MVLGEVEVERRVLDGRQEDVREVLPLRHPPLERASAEHPAPEHGVDGARRDRLDELGEDRGVVLVVRVDHDADVRAARERRRVAGLLVPAVAEVPVVDDDVDPRDRARGLDGPVVRGVVHEDDVVDPLLRDLVERLVERLLRVVRRHDDGDALSVDRHGRILNDFRGRRRRGRRGSAGRCGRRASGPPFASRERGQERDGRSGRPTRGRGRRTSRPGRPGDRPAAAA